MSPFESVTLVGIMVALAAMPSASVAFVVARSVTLGIANGLAAAAGIVLGDLAFIALALFGLSVVAETMGSLFVIIKILGGFYLVWLGFFLLTARGSKKIIACKSNGGKNLLTSFFAGFFLTLGDVKAIIFYASLLPLFVELSRIESPEIITIVLITIFSVGGVKSAYAILAKTVTNYAKDTTIEIATRKVAGGLMLSAGGYLIVKA